MISCGAQILRAVGGCPTRHGIRTCIRYLPHSLGAYKNALNPEKQRPVDLAFEFQQGEWQAVPPPSPRDRRGMVGLCRLVWLPT